MVSKYIKKCSTSLVIKEMQIKAILQFHLTPVRMAIFKGITTTNAGENAETGTLIHCWWECKLIQPLWKIEWMGIPKNAKNRTVI
jgi:hypothetical protein